MEPEGPQKAITIDKGQRLGSDSQKESVSSHSHPPYIKYTPFNVPQNGHNSQFPNMVLKGGYWIRVGKGSTFKL